MKDKFKLFATGFFQVAFVSANVHFISAENYFAQGITGFMISYIWTFNVRKVAFGDHPTRLIYSIGAMLGGLFGVFVSSLLTK